MPANAGWYVIETLNGSRCLFHWEPTIWRDTALALLEYYRLPGLDLSVAFYDGTAWR